MGRHKEAVDELNIARRLDPRSLPINTAFGTLAYYSRDYQEAIRQLKNTLEIDDAYPLVHTRLGLAYEQQGDTQDAVLSFLRARSLMPASQEKTASLRKAFSDQGRDAFWREYLSQLTRESKERYVPQTAIAAVQTRLGKNDQALDTLARAIEEKDVGLVELKVEPVFEPLRSNSKFSELLRRVGLTRKILELAGRPSGASCSDDHIAETSVERLISVWSKIVGSEPSAAIQLSCGRHICRLSVQLV